MHGRWLGRRVPGGKAGVVRAEERRSRRPATSRSYLGPWDAGDGALAAVNG